MIFAIVNAIFALMVAGWIIFIEYRLRQLERKRQHPLSGVHGSVKISKQLRDGLIDVDLHR